MTTVSSPLKPADAGSLRRLSGLTRGELGAAIAEMGEPKFRANQLWHWLYCRGATDFGEMTSLSKDFRSRLSGTCAIERPVPVRDQLSEDGTRKWLFRFPDGQEAETVFIPESDRGTLCISSQVGCTLTCKFCHTGTQKLVRNLSVAEIIGQLLAARDHLGDWPSAKPDRLITNLVFMGMGEPLYNYDNVRAALEIITDGEGIGISKRRITLSTAGVVPMMQQCGEETGVNLAVSLHAVTDELRDVIVPINKKYPIAELLDACRAYPGVNNARRITFEYVLLKGVNDSQADAKELIRLLKGIPAKVNLIPFNPWPGAPFDCSPPDVVHAFSETVNAGGLIGTVRTPRGSDILAACGQLKSESVRLSIKERRAAAAAPA